MAYRSMPATRSLELSPFQVLFGETMSVPGDVNLLPKPTLPETYQQILKQHLDDVKICREVARQNMLHNQELNRSEHDRNKKAQEPTFKVGEQVLMRNEAVPVGLVPKLHPPYRGPYWITRYGPNFTYHLQDINGKPLSGAINGRRIIPYLERLTSEPVVSPPLSRPETPPVSDNTPPQQQAELIQKLQNLIKNNPSPSHVDTPRETQIPQTTGQSEHTVDDDARSDITSDGGIPPSDQEENAAPQGVNSTPLPSEDPDPNPPPPADQQDPHDRPTRNVVEVIKSSRANG